MVTFGILWLSSCGSKSEGYVIRAKVHGNLNEGTKVFLKTTDSLNRLVDIDTAIVENGTFSFSGIQTEPKLHYILIESGKGNIPFFLENGEIDLKFQKDSLNYAQLKGTLQNELFMDFLDESRKMAARTRSMQRDMRQAAQEQDTATVGSLREEYLELQEEVRTFNIDFAKENPNALISVLIIGNLTMGNVLPTKEIMEMFEALAPEVRTSVHGKNLKKQLDKLKITDIGGVAPEFSAPTPQGNALALSDAKGKVTLVDFWAAWCRPCRAENPNIVSVYKKYHQKGLNIIGVSLDTRAEDWIRAIEADGLKWNHISNLKRFQDPIAQLYNITAIPAAFLLDENGVIVAKNLRGPALEQKVAELLN